MNNETRPLKLHQGNILILAIFSMAVIIGLIGYIAYGDVPVVGDALLHKNLGLEVLSGSWVKSETFGDVETPGYPFILGSIYGIFGPADIAVKLTQVFIYALAAVLVFTLGNLVFGRLVGILSAIWYITYYDFISSAYQIMREIWIVFFILLFLLFAARYIKKKTLLDLSLFSVAFGFVVMLDPRYFFFLVVLLVIVSIVEREWLLRVRSVLIVIAGVGVFLTPWMVRQSIVSSRFILFSPQRDSQMRSFLGIGGVGREEDDIACINMGKDDYLRDLRASGLPLSKQHDIEERLTDEYIERMQQKIPKTTPHILLHRALEYWRFARFGVGVRTGYDMRFEYPWSFTKNINNILHVGLLIPFFVIAGFLMLYTRSLSQVLILVFIMYHMLFHILVHYLYRYRYPVLPLMFLLGWYGVYYVGNRLRRVHDIQK